MTGSVGDLCAVVMDRVANVETRFLEEARTLEDVRVAIDIAGQQFVLILSRGTAALDSAPVSRGWDIRLSGAEQAWIDVLSGTSPLIRETNVMHGRILTEGDAVIAAWAMPALGRLFRTTRKAEL